MTINEVVQ